MAIARCVQETKGTLCFSRRAGGGMRQLVSCTQLSSCFCLCCCTLCTNRTHAKWLTHAHNVSLRRKTSRRRSCWEQSNRSQLSPIYKVLNMEQQKHSKLPQNATEHNVVQKAHQQHIIYLHTTKAIWYSPTSTADHYYNRANGIVDQGSVCMIHEAHCRGSTVV